MQAADALLAPIDTRSVVEWCEDEVMLTERQTQSPGHFSTDLTPYLREPLECFGDVDVSDLVLVFGTQTGKTTMVQAGTAWRIVNKPQPVVWVMPTEGLARHARRSEASGPAPIQKPRAAFFAVLARLRRQQLPGKPRQPPRRTPPHG